MSECRHFLVKGQVQGVFYRVSCKKKARELGLGGWVRNCPDGSVEAIACGEDTQLQAFERWLWDGPERASVSEVTVSPESFSEHTGFEIR